MKETAKAREAFADYQAMPPGERSIESLHQLYLEREESGRETPPTTRLNTLYTWSTEHGWQDRIAEVDRQLLEKLTEQFAHEREVILTHGLALSHERIRALVELAEQWLAEAKVEQWMDDVKFRPMGRGIPSEPVEVRRYNQHPGRLALQALADIAAEMGARRQSFAIEGSEDRPIPIRLVTVQLPPESADQTDGQEVSG